MRRLERPGRAVLDPVVVGDQPLVHQVKGVEPQVVLANMERAGGLARGQPLQVGDEDLDDEPAAGPSGPAPGSSWRRPQAARILESSLWPAPAAEYERANGHAVGLRLGEACCGQLAGEHQTERVGAA
jgi:hypothetical protein